MEFKFSSFLWLFFISFCQNSCKSETCLFVLFGSLFIASDSLPLSFSLIMHTRPLFSSVSVPARRSQYSSAHKHRDRKRGKEAAREWEKGSCDSNKNEWGAGERWRLGWTSGRREGGGRGHTHVEQPVCVHVCVCVCVCVIESHAEREINQAKHR